MNPSGFYVDPFEPTSTHNERQKEKRQLLDFLQLTLILFVDQPGLEPGTSRLRVCCSNQLSYKSVLTISC